MGRLSSSWEIQPVFRLQLGRSSQKRSGRRVCNSEQVHGQKTNKVPTMDIRSLCLIGVLLTEPGKWNHYHAGDFVVEDPNVSTKIELSMTQIDFTHTKGGLFVDTIVIYLVNLEKV